MLEIATPSEKFFNSYGMHENCYSKILWQLNLRHDSKIDLYYLSELSKQVHAIVLNAKEKNIRTSQKVIALHLYRALYYFAAQYNLSKIELLPLPSRHQNDFRRGYKHFELVTKLIIEISNTNNLLRINNLTISVCPYKFKYTRKVADQRNLNQFQRIVNLKNAFILMPSPQNSFGVKPTRLLKYFKLKEKLKEKFRVTPATINNSITHKSNSKYLIDSPVKVITSNSSNQPAAAIFLIDDVMTTASSMKEAVRACQSANIFPILGITFAGSKKSH